MYCRKLLKSTRDNHEGRDNHISAKKILVLEKKEIRPVLRGAIHAMPLLEEIYSGLLECHFQERPFGSPNFQDSHKCE